MKNVRTYDDIAFLIDVSGGYPGLKEWVQQVVSRWGLKLVGGTTGDPAESTLMFMVLIYRNAFRYFKMGYASAQAVVLFVVVLAVTLVIFRTARLWVFSETDEKAA